MITSPTPWSFKIETNYLEGPTPAFIYDANGNEIGSFKDSNDAEKVCSMVDEIQKLTDKIEELEWQLP